MHILSTVEAWRELAALPSAQDRAAAWVSSYEARYQSVFDLYHGRGWGSRAKRVEAAAQAPALVDRVLAAEERARHLVARAHQDFRERALLTDDLSVVLLVGTHTSNGWVTEHEGRPTLFLALEYLGRPPHDDLLVVHELTHAVQGQLSRATRRHTFAASLATMVEGAASETTRVLRPGHSGSAYLWFDDGHADWLSDCEASVTVIASLLLRHLDTPDDDEAVAPLLRNRPGQGVPARCGYWAGQQIAATMLANGSSLRDLLGTGPSEARALVRDWASAHRG